jgi:hypothetical protein
MAGIIGENDHNERVSHYEKQKAKQRQKEENYRQKRSEE